MTIQGEKRLIQAAIAVVLLSAVGMMAYEYARRSPDRAAAAANRETVAMLLAVMRHEPVGPLSAAPIPEPTRRRAVYRLAIDATVDVTRGQSTVPLETSDLVVSLNYAPRLGPAVGRIAQANGVGPADVLAIAREGAAAGW